MPILVPARILLSLVYRNNVSPKVRGEGKVLVALIALVLALVMDGHHVSLEIRRKRERLAAQIALVDRPHFLRRFQGHVARSQRRPNQSRA